MAKSTETTVQSQATQSQEEFVRQYMAELKTRRREKVSLVDRITGWAEDRVVNATKNSKRVYGRLSAALEIADDIADEAYATEHARHAAAQAKRLGLA